MAKAAAAKGATKKQPTKSQIFASIADETGLSKKQIASVFDALIKEVSKNLGGKGVGIMTIPGLVKLTRKKVPARPAQKNVLNPLTGKYSDRPARPASNTVRARVLKSVKQMV